MSGETLALADELAAAYETRRHDVVPPSARGIAWDLPAAYAVEAELRKRRVASGHRAVERKVGYVNKAVWRVFKLDTVVWGHMYDDTVAFASGNMASLSLEQMIAPKIEPEIVLKLKSALPGEGLDAAGALHTDRPVGRGFSRGVRVRSPKSEAGGREPGPMAEGREPRAEGNSEVRRSPQEKDNPRNPRNPLITPFCVIRLNPRNTSRRCDASASRSKSPQQAERDSRRDHREG